jgi:hypothetical protein
MRRLTLFLLIPAISLVIACTGYGEKVVYEGTEVYYKDGATKEEADKMGAYLVKSGYADGNPKSVMLVRNPSNNNMVVRQVVATEKLNAFTEMAFMIMGAAYPKEVFDNQPVDLELCDNTFKTVKSFSYDEMKKFAPDDTIDAEGEDTDEYDSGDGEDTSDESGY